MLMATILRLTPCDTRQTTLLALPSPINEAPTLTELRWAGHVVDAPLDLHRREALPRCILRPWAEV